MGEYTYSDNTKGPFNLHKGSKYNAKCPRCLRPTWCCAYPHQTVYVGYKYVDHLGKVVGVLDLNGNVFCEECYIKRFGNEEK